MSRNHAWHVEIIIFMNENGMIILMITYHTIITRTSLLGPSLLPKKKKLLPGEEEEDAGDASPLTMMLRR